MMPPPITNLVKTGLLSINMPPKHPLLIMLWSSKLNPVLMALSCFKGHFKDIGKGLALRMVPLK